MIYNVDGTNIYEVNIDVSKMDTSPKIYRKPYSSGTCRPKPPISLITFKDSGSMSLISSFFKALLVSWKIRNIDIIDTTFYL